MTRPATILHFAIPLADIRAGPSMRRVFFEAHQQPTVASINQFFHTMSQHPIPNRILALDPMTRGFGYVLFEQPFHLAECGFARVKGDKRLGALAKFEQLLADFGPRAVVLEDAAAPGSRRHYRVRELINDLAALARKRGLAVATVARTAVVARFTSGEKRATKQTIAQDLVRHFPELRLKLPKPRKPWESKRERMSIFDALALAVTHVTE